MEIYYSFDYCCCYFPLFITAGSRNLIIIKIFKSLFSFRQKRTKRTISRHHAPEVIESHYQRFCITLLFFSLLSTPLVCLPLISITVFFFFLNLSPTGVCSLCLPRSLEGRDFLPQSESRWATMTDIISSEQITTLRIHSRPPLAPAKLKLCSSCQIERKKKLINR